jgi:hypothetical protein
VDTPLRTIPVGRSSKVIEVKPIDDVARWLVGEFGRLWKRQHGRHDRTFPAIRAMRGRIR